MRIAQIAPLWEAVPPKTYGGTELVVSLLTEELTKRGHEVTLFTVGDCQLTKRPNLRIVKCLEKPMRELGIPNQEGIYYELMALEKVFSQTRNFDIIHNHMGYQALPFAALQDTPFVSTLHGVFKPEALHKIIEHYGHLPYVSISDYQRKPAPDLNYVATVYHGLRLDRYNPCFNEKEKDYYAFLGRFSPEKGPHHAIEIAKATGRKLVMAGKVDPVDETFFKEVIEPKIDNKQIFYIGEVNHTQKVDLLRNAIATLCPVTWPEPFGLVLIESMACGTPVLALRDGSIPEVVSHGFSGFIADSVAEMIAYAEQVTSLSRKECRQYVEQRFSVERMTDDYLAVYQSLTRRDEPQQAAARVVPLPTVMTPPAAREIIHRY